MSERPAYIDRRPMAARMRSVCADVGGAPPDKHAVRVLAVATETYMRALLGAAVAEARARHAQHKVRSDATLAAMRRAADAERVSAATAAATAVAAADLSSPLRDGGDDDTSVAIKRARPAAAARGDAHASSTLLDSAFDDAWAQVMGDDYDDDDAASGDAAPPTKRPKPAHASVSGEAQQRAADDDHHASDERGDASPASALFSTLFDDAWSQVMGDDDSDGETVTSEVADESDCDGDDAAATSVLATLCDDEAPRGIDTRGNAADNDAPSWPQRVASANAVTRHIFARWRRGERAERQRVHRARLVRRMVRVPPPPSAGNVLSALDGGAAARALPTQRVDAAHDSATSRRDALRALGERELFEVEYGDDERRASDALRLGDVLVAGGDAARMAVARYEACERSHGASAALRRDVRRSVFGVAR